MCFPEEVAEINKLLTEAEQINNVVPVDTIGDTFGYIIHRLGIMMEKTQLINNRDERSIRYRMIADLTKKLREIQDSRRIFLETISTEFVGREEIAPDHFYNTEIKKCVICRSLSDMNILIVTDEKECPICITVVNRMMAFKCGHSCCCFGCFKKL